MPIQSIWSLVQIQVAGLAGRLGLGVAVFVVLWVSGLLAEATIRRVGGIRQLDPSLTQLLARAAKLALLLAGAICGLGTLGVDVTALVAGLGLTGFALGFALKDIISNALAGILVIMYKPFRTGDRISVAGVEGKIVEIDLRYTTLRSNEQTVYVPNSMVFSGTVTVLQRD